MKNNFSDELKSFIVIMLGVVLFVAGSPLLSAFYTPYYLILTLLGGGSLIVYGCYFAVRKDKTK